MVHQKDTSIGLSCPAQGYPLPAFRCVTNCWFLKIIFFRTHWWSKTKIFPDSKWSSNITWLQFCYFIVLSRSGISITSIQVRSITFLCYWNIISEPIGGQKPKFSENVHSKSIIREVKYPVTLECPAQGFPLPAFRLDKSPFLLEYHFRTYWWS